MDDKTIAKEYLAELSAAIDAAEAELTPMQKEDEFSLRDIRNSRSVSYDRARKILAQMIKAGIAEEAGVRRRFTGGKEAMSYRLVKL